jgi:hypothetical protein
MDLEFNPKTQTITAGTYGRGAWQAHLPSCVLSCSAQGPSNALVNQPASFTASSSGQGCTGTATYSWDFGDGTAVSTETNPQHTYTATGRFTWICTASLESSRCTQSGQVSVTQTPPPTVSSMRKQGGPFRIKVSGAHFQNGLKVAINGADWSPVTRKSEGNLVLGGGASLKAAVPKGTPANFTFTNPDGGSFDITWSW